MSDFETIDILYAEDSPTDAEVTLRALNWSYPSAREKIRCCSGS